MIYISVFLVIISLATLSYQLPQKKEELAIGDEGINLVLGQFAKETVKLEDLKVGFWHSASKLEMNEGRITGLSSVQQVGSTEITKIKDGVKLIFYVKFPRLAIRYDKYDVNTLSLNLLKGKWDDENIDNKFKLTIHMEPLENNKCKVEAVNIDIIELKKVNLSEKWECRGCHLLINIKKALQEKLDEVVNGSLMEFVNNSINDGNNILGLDCSFKNPLKP